MVPVDLRATILVRGLAYERNLATETGALKLVILGEASGSSSRDAVAFDTKVRSLAERFTVGARAIRSRRVTFVNPAQAMTAIREYDADAVYLAAGLESAASSLGDRLISDGRLLMCGSSTAVGRGCALSVEVHDNRPRLVVDLDRARRAGRNFDARLLRLARVVQ